MAAIAAVTVTVTVTVTVSDGVLQGIWKKHLRPKTRGTFVSESLQSQIASTSNNC